MGKQSNLTIEQRTAATLSLIRKEEPAAKIARRYGISEPTLYRYRDLFLEGGKAGIASGAGSPIHGTRKSRTSRRPWNSVTRSSVN